MIDPAPDPLAAEFQRTAALSRECAALPLAAVSAPRVDSDPPPPAAVLPVAQCGRLLISPTSRAVAFTVVVSKAVDPTVAVGSKAVGSMEVPAAAEHGAADTGDRVISSVFHLKALCRNGRRWDIRRFQRKDRS
jgi:hypothetical protein